MLIIRRSNCINTASGIVFSVSDRPVCRLRRNLLHVSSNSVLIIRTSNCINTASGIVFCVSDRPVCRLTRKFLLNLNTGRSLTENTVQDTVLIQFDVLMMSTELLETCRGL